MTSIRENWRLTLLVVAVVVATFLLFSPTLASGASGASGSNLTNLKYGLELSGGTSIKAPLEGWTAEGIQYSGNNRTAVEDAVSDRIPGVPTRQVELLSPRQTTLDAWALEVRANVSKATVESAVTGAGLSPSRIRRGVTKPTREQVVRILQDKISETGIEGGTVRTIYSVTDQRHYVSVEVPNANRTELLDLITEPGRVKVLAYHPVQRNGTTVYVNRTVLTNDDFADIKPAKQATATRGPRVPVRLKSESAKEFQEAMVETGIAARGAAGNDCGWPGGTGTCLLTVKDGEVVYSAGMSESLARPMRKGTWASDPGFVLVTGNFSQAQDLAVDLRAGALPTTLAIERGSVEFVSPTFGASARLNALVAAIAAILAVSGVVMVRYGEVRIAVPMVLTGVAEVWLMLGFAAGVGLALDLSHIAGFIAVIGTGVDDLVIIADDIMQQGDVSTGRVFKSRFRKALWVIGAAAATTIIAMSPLAIMSLQDLQGFAIVTIVGVLLGVLVTRPAYGDVLRNLVLERG